MVRRTFSTGHKDKESNFYMAAWINWYSKADKLEFYNDEEDHIEHPPPPPKPRRCPKTEIEEEYAERLREWDALKPYDIEVKVKGNSMTQKYYVDRPLPTYAQAVNNKAQNEPGEWLFQDDRGPSRSI